MKITFALLFSLILFSACNENVQVKKPQKIATAKDTAKTKIGSLIESFHSYDFIHILQKTPTPFSTGILTPYHFAKEDTMMPDAMLFGMRNADVFFLFLTQYDKSLHIHIENLYKNAKGFELQYCYNKAYWEKYYKNNDCWFDTVFTKSMRYLNMYGKRRVAALIMASYWLENMYFVAELSAGNSNPEIITHLEKQKQVIDDLYYVLNFYSFEHVYDAMAFKIKKIKNIYDEAQTTAKPSEFHLTQNQISRIYTTVKEIRKQCIENAKERYK